MYQSVIASLQAKQFTEAEKHALQIACRVPLEAQPWVYLGEALLHQGQGAASRKVFHRALMLDPLAVWAEGVARTLEKVPPGADRPDIDELLAIRKVTVAAGIIAKNEMRCLKRCLESLVEAVDEIVVIDNGSTDGTKEFAASFPKVKVIETEWNDDFAGLRNAGLPHFRSDWVIWVDADEELLPEDAGQIRTLAGMFNNTGKPALLYAGVMEKQNGRIGDPAYDKARMFPLRFGIRYKGRVHEQIVPAGGNVFEGDFIRKPVRIRFIHDGYDSSASDQANKLERNLRLLRMMLDEEPENPTWWWFFGRETLGNGDRPKALEALLKAEALAKLEPRFGRKADIRMLLAHIYMTDNDWEQSESICRRMLEDSPNYPDALFLLAQIEMRQAYFKLQDAEVRLREAKEACFTYRGATPADLRIAEWKADLAIAELAANAGNLAMAEKICLQLLTRFPDLNQASQLLQRIKQSHKQDV